jgi:hypothetical protein
MRPKQVKAGEGWTIGRFLYIRRGTSRQVKSKRVLLRVEQLWHAVNAHNASIWLTFGFWSRSWVCSSGCLRGAGTGYVRLTLMSHLKHEFTSVPVQNKMSKSCRGSEECCRPCGLMTEATLTLASEAANVLNG